MSLRERGQAYVHLVKAAQHDISYSLAGRLQLANTGWLVLTVPASFVRGAFDALHEEGAQLPEFYAIPVMSPQEITKLGGPDKITERGHSFTYNLGPIRSHEPGRLLSKRWYIQIYSQELKRLRHSYGLDPYMKGHHSFQLPVAVRKTNAIMPGNEVTKVSAHIYLKEPNWDDYDLEAVEKIASDAFNTIPLPDIKQQKNNDCGPAALTSVLKYYDRTTNLDTVTKDVELPKAGLPPHKIISYAKEKGFNVEEGTLTFKQLTDYIDKGIPVITPIQAYGDPSTYDRNDNGHYVVVCGYDEESVYVQDPRTASDTRGAIRRSDFLSRWHDRSKDGVEYDRYGIAIWKAEPPETTESLSQTEKVAHRKDEHGS